MTSIVSVTDKHDRGQTSDPLVPTIFHEPWWLSAATDGRYEEVTVTSAGRTVGRLPYVRENHLGFSVCVAPNLTHFLGPAVVEGSGNPVNRTIRRHQITRELIQQLPRCSFFWQQMHRGTPDALPFGQQGFKLGVRFTYEVAPEPEAILWRNLRDKTRNVIRRAKEQTELVELEVPEFLALYQANLERRGASTNQMYNSATASSVLGAALSRGRGRLIGARDESGAIIASVFYVWDDAVTYNLLTTRAPASHNGVVSWLIWEAIRHSAASGRIFDFDGVGTDGSVLFYSAFGGEVRPRFVAERSAYAYRAAVKILEGSESRLPHNRRAI